MTENGPHSKLTSKIFAHLQLYNENDDKWVFIKPPTVGDIKYSIHETDHSGWLICDGRSLSRADYPELFDLIGTKYGSASGTTFNLPDCRGRVLGAVGAGSGLTARSAGTLIGAETHTLTVGEMPSHNHTVTDPGHSHTYTNNTNDQNTDNAFASETAADNADLSQTTGISTTGITINNTGGGGAHNNMQPTAFIGNVFLFAQIFNKPIITSS
jgi:microcystin-dependent protein